MALNSVFSAKWIRSFISCVVIVQLVLLSACTSTTIDVHNSNPIPSSNWVILPFQNASGVPLAGEKITSILATLLRNRGVRFLKNYKYQPGNDAWEELDENYLQSRAFEWAKKNGINFAVTGVVEEWHYKSGVAGEPAVGFSLEIVYVPTGNVLWSATGSRSGWGRDTLRGVAQELLGKMLLNINLYEINQKAAG